MYLWNHWFSKIPLKKFDRFLPWKLIQNRYVILSPSQSCLENKQNKSHVPSLWKLPGQKSVKFFLWYFGKLMISLIHYDIIWPLGLEMANPFWERFKTISNMANLIPTSFQLTCSQIVLDLSLTCVLPDWSRLVQKGTSINDVRRF